MRVVQLVRLAKVREWDHARDQRDASPPEVCSPGPTEMTVNALVRHHRAEKYQVSSQQDIENHQHRMGEGNEERTDREKSNEADDRAAEIVDLGSVWHVGSLGKAGLLDYWVCGS